MSAAYPPPRYAELLRSLLFTPDGKPHPNPRPPAPPTARPVDRALGTYAVTRAILLLPAKMRPELLIHSMRDRTVPHILPLAEATPPLPASRGSEFACAAWYALALQAAATAADKPAPEAARAFSTLAAAQLPTGPFLTPTPSDNLETLWYHELVLLHALTTYALLTNSAPLLDAAKRAALYHLHETQPDHATTQPWALNAFLLSPDTYPLADQILHTLQIQNPDTLDHTSHTLIADTRAGGINPRIKPPRTPSTD